MSKTFSLEELATRWNLDTTALQRLVGSQTTISLEQVEQIEAGWQQALQAKRADWNERLAKRRVVKETMSVNLDLELLVQILNSNDGEEEVVYRALSPALQRYVDTGDFSYVQAYSTECGIDAQTVDALTDIAVAVTNAAIVMANQEQPESTDNAH